MTLGRGSSYGDLIDLLATELRSFPQAKWIVEKVSGLDSASIGPLSKELVADDVIDKAMKLVGRVKAGEPIQYVLESWDFRYLRLSINRSVLIPRPETEVVAGYVIDEIRQRFESREDATFKDYGIDKQLFRVADLGTGSGAIALSVAKEIESRFDIEVIGTDLSQEALEVAKTNLEALDLSVQNGVKFIQGSWFDPLDDYLLAFDIVVSNPPYISPGQYEELDSCVKDFEPKMALVAADEGLSDLIHIASNAMRYLKNNGMLVLECDPDQIDPLVKFLKQANYYEVESHLDLALRPRFVSGRIKANSLVAENLDLREI
ncbi:MAG: peptide chain release factor N(5)-glutamine methyltransferase [Acidimicrobiales bacterium]|nr:peptide chain release factor N(5)-glutamine methyltransferase [Acidimicrobiales bacterium]